MPKYPPIAEVVRRIKESAESKLRIVGKTLPIVIAKRDAELVHVNVRTVASACLRAAMVYARYDQDWPLARQYLGRCVDYADVLSDAEKQGLAGTPWSGFYVLYASLIVGRFDKAEQVANWMIRCPVVAEDAADPHDPLALLTGYGALDMREKFEQIRPERYDHSWHASHPFFGPLSVYLDLWQAILSRDQGAFDAAMIRREEHCVRLSKQKDEGRLEFGGGEDSKYVIDFMGIGCAVAARRKGMTCDVDTTYLPRAMTELAFS